MAEYPAKETVDQRMTRDRKLTTAMDTGTQMLRDRMDVENEKRAQEAQAKLENDPRKG